ncbi:hypothetical protein [Deinococcus planocerae]|uniref:hypothetical protein n=1 Tax=Deinococcus planocerae TaxID=1737569 RepID=UPI000C7EF286|nr:hypothetical protein [Deinococcus planocerae]
MPDHPRTLRPHDLPWELSRTALLARLAAPPPARLVALIAPAGYGKTTLLAQLTRDRARTLWLDLTPDHADPAVLAAHLARSLQTLEPGLHLPPWLHLDLQERPNPTHLATRAGELGEAVVFVFDGLELLGSSAGEWLGHFALALNEGQQVLLAGRDAPGLPLPSLVARGRATVLTAQDLAFSEDEVQAYLRRCGADLDARELAHLQGWPAGVALGAAGSAAHLDPLDLVLEVLGHLAPEVRGVLAEAAVFPEWEEHAVRAAGARLPPGWLREVRRAGVLLSPLGAGRYRPHALLLGALERELRTRPARYRVLHTRAGELAEARGDALAALRHHLAAGQRSRALALAEQVTDRLLRRGEYRLVRQVLAEFGDAELPAALLVRQGVACGYVGEAALGEALLRRVHADPREGWRALAALANISGKQGNFGLARQLAEEGLTHPQLQDAGDQVELRSIRAQAGLLLGQHEEALEDTARTVALAERSAQPLLLAQALWRRGETLEHLGQGGEAEHALRRALRLFQELGLPRRALAPAHALISLLFRSGRLEEAQRLAAQGLGVAATDTPARHAQFLNQQGQIERYLGRPAQAREAFEAALEVSTACGLHTDVVYAKLELADVARQLGDLTRSRALLGELTNLQDEQEGQYGVELRAVVELYRALLVLAQGDVPEAAARLAQVAKDDLLSEDTQVRLLAFRAEAARRSGQLDLSRVQALTAELGALGSDAVLNVDRDELASLFAECARRGWWPARLARFVPALAPGDGAVLRLTTLGRFGAEIGGQPLAIPLRKSRELLVYLAWRGPASSAHLIDLLFEGSRERRHEQYFRRALRALRQALQDAAALEPILLVDGEYRLHERLTVQVDVAALLADAPPDPLDAWPAGDDLTFLPGSDGEWVEEVRARVVDRAVAVALDLGRRAEDTAPELALGHYRRALHLDPLAEAAHQAVIALYRRLGNGVGAHQAAREYERAFGVAPPSAPTPRPPSGA